MKLSSGMRPSAFAAAISVSTSDRSIGPSAIPVHPPAKGKVTTCGNRAAHSCAAVCASAPRRASTRIITGSASAASGAAIPASASATTLSLPFTRPPFTRPPGTSPPCSLIRISPVPFLLVRRPAAAALH